MSPPITSSAVDSILADLDGVCHPVTSSLTLPPACYTSDEFRVLEADRVLRQSWIGIGRADRCRQPGDYLTVNLVGVETIVIRDEDGRLRAFANSCRHRGSLMLEGSGHCRVIRCPFHSWTYDCRGRLIAAPRMEATEGFEPAAHGLVEFRLQCRDGFAFVCLHDDTVDLDDWLGDFSEMHWPWALDELVTARVREMEVGCNWKAFIEVFNEYYHLPYVHPKSLEGMYQEPDDVDVVMGQYTTQFGRTNGTAALFRHQRDNPLPAGPRLADPWLEGTRYTWVYPNLTFAAGPDSLWMYEAYPDGADRCRVVQTICFPRDTVTLPDFEERASLYYERYDGALAEDLPFLEQQQRGLDSPYAKQGRFSSLEPSVGNFACWYAQAAVHGAASTAL